MTRVLLLAGLAIAVIGLGVATGAVLLAVVIVMICSLGARVYELSAQVNQERRNRLSDRAAHRDAIEMLTAALADYDDLAGRLRREQDGQAASGT